MKAHVQNLKLRNGSRIAVIGAGPAGTFFSHFLSRLAREKGLNLSITLFDAKDFNRQGPHGCNLCAGVISETMVQLLNTHGLTLPEKIVQRKIEGYFLQIKAGGFLLKHPSEEKLITTVYRGNGPRFYRKTDNISFDSFLLNQVLHSDNINLITEPVNSVELPSDLRKSVKILYGHGRKKELIFNADLVVGAFGLNTSLMKKMQILNFGYKPPHTLNATCMEIPLEEDFIFESMGNNIFICNWRSPWGLCFAGIIPKKDYITVNIIGTGGVKEKDLEKFLSIPAVKKRLPANWELPDNYCVCSPQIATTASKRPFTDRLVIIGDASCTRYYKNGIESAFKTAQLAAETAIHRGISKAAFKRGYFSQARKQIIWDNFFGKVLFGVYNFVYESSFFSEVLMRVAIKEETHGKSSQLKRVLWNMYTGNTPYSTIFIQFLNPFLQWKLIVETVKFFFIRRKLK